MTEPVQPSRTFVIPDDPADRLHRVRTAARVIMLDRDGRVLLFCDTDPGLPKFRWWVTPGGGIDPGETEQQAAVREVAEETGAVIAEDDLVGPIARRVAVHGYSDQVIEQDEAFYAARVDTFDVDVTGHTPEEQITFKGWRWWSTEDLRASDEWVWPRELEEILLLLDQSDRWPVELGFQEESTVPDVA